MPRQHLSSAFFVLIKQWLKQKYLNRACLSLNKEEKQMVHFDEVLDYYSGIPFSKILHFEDYTAPSDNEFENSRIALAMLFYVASTDPKKPNEQRNDLVLNSLMNYSAWKFNTPDLSELVPSQKIHFINDVYHSCRIVDQKTTQPRKVVLRKENEKTIRYVEELLFQNMDNLMAVSEENPVGSTYLDYFNNLKNLQKELKENNELIENPFKPFASNLKNRDLLTAFQKRQANMLFSKSLGLISLLDDNYYEFEELVGYYRNTHKDKSFNDLATYANIADFGETIARNDINKELPLGNSLRNFARYLKDKQEKRKNE